MREKIQVRAAGSEGAETIGPLLAVCLDPPWSTAAIASFLETPGSFGFIARHAVAPGADSRGQSAAHRHAVATTDECLGFILCRVAADACDLAAVGVAPARRRRGIAGALLAAVFEEARRRGAGHIFLEVAETNGPAVELYRSQGFREIGRRARYYRTTNAETPVDALVMRKDL